MGGCFEGEKIPMELIGKTDSQKALMSQLGQIFGNKLNSGAGATPFPGPLSAPPDQSMIAAMNTMMGKGGYGPYQPPGFPMNPLAGPPTDWSPGYNKPPPKERPDTPPGPGGDEPGGPGADKSRFKYNA